MISGVTSETGYSYPVAVIIGRSNPILYFIQPDHLGTPRVVINAAGTVVWRWDSDPFGWTSATEDPDGDGQRFTLNLRFPGQYLDQETNLHYNYYRDYDPQIGAVHRERSDRVGGRPEYLRLRAQ